MTASRWVLLGMCALTLVVLCAAGLGLGIKFLPPMPAVNAAGVAATITLTPTPTLTATVTCTPTPAYTATVTLTPTATLGVGSSLVSPVDSMVLVYVPAGEFSMGSSDGNKDEKPVHTVFLDAFWIDQYEVSNEQFWQFVSATGYITDAEKDGGGYIYNYSKRRWERDPSVSWRTPGGTGTSLQGLEMHPVMQVTWNDALAYCTWAGRALPSEAQWEKAARGTDGRIYPWGDSIELTFANYAGAFGYTVPVGSYPIGLSPYGALDMAGNAWEWVNDWYSEDYYKDSPYMNPEGPASGEQRIYRGGSWRYNATYSRATYRLGDYPDFPSGYYGFRCALTP